MPIWPYGTQMRVGAPSTVNLTAEQIEIFYATVPLAWAAPILGLIGAEEIDVAEMCASEPAPDEIWNVNDIVRSLVPATQQFEKDKLRRMAIAAIWPTYCEFSPPGPELQEPLVYRAAGFAGNFHGENFAVQPVFDYNIPVGDVWVLAITCEQPITTGTAPSWHVIRPDDSLGPPMAPFWPNYVGETQFYMAAKFYAYETFEGSGIRESMEPNNGQFRIVLPLSDGKWRCVSWSFTYNAPPVPPEPEAWAEAPEDPFVGPMDPTLFQFTWEQANMMVEAADSQLSNESMLTNMNTVLNDHYGQSILDQEAIMAAFAALPAPTGGTAGAAWPPLWEFGDYGPGELTGSMVIDIPAGNVGAAVFLHPPAYAARTGVEPEALFNVGRWAQGPFLGWWKSEPLRHPIQIIYPFYPGATRLAFDFPPECGADMYWLRAAPPPDP